MKVIRINGDIISLENITSVRETRSGSGCKSNPYAYYIRVNYHDREWESAEVETEEEQKKIMEKIYEILQEEA